MSIKAGRVGVNPSQVDPVDGSILSSATSGYTKQEADAKFLTQTDAASTYESKDDASTAHNALQPKTLAVPIEMLSGTKLTVENALHGLSDVQKSVVDTELTLTTNYVKRCGNLVTLCIGGNSLSVAEWGSLGTLPEGYRPSENVILVPFIATTNKVGFVTLHPNGNIEMYPALNNENLRVSGSFLVDNS